MSDDHVFLDTVLAGPCSPSGTSSGPMKSALSRSPSSSTKAGSPRRVAFNKADNDIQFFDFEQPSKDIRRSNSDSSDRYSALRQGFIKLRTDKKKSPLASALLFTACIEEDLAFALSQDDVEVAPKSTAIFPIVTVATTTATSKMNDDKDAGFATRSHHHEHPRLMTQPQQQVRSPNIGSKRITFV